MTIPWGFLELSNKAIRNIDEAIAGVRERGEIWRG